MVLVSNALKQEKESMDKHIYHDTEMAWSLCKPIKYGGDIHMGSLTNRVAIE